MPPATAHSRVLRASMRRLRTIPSTAVKKMLAMMQLEVKYSGLERWMVKGVKSTWTSSDSTVLYDMVRAWQSCACCGATRAPCALAPLTSQQPCTALCAASRLPCCALKSEALRS